MSSRGQAEGTNLPACFNASANGWFYLAVSLAAVYSTLFVVLRFRSGIEDWFELCLVIYRCRNTSVLVLRR